MISAACRHRESSGGSLGGDFSAPSAHSARALPSAHDSSRGARAPPRRCQSVSASISEATHQTPAPGGLSWDCARLTQSSRAFSSTKSELVCAQTPPSSVVGFSRIPGPARTSLYARSNGGLGSSWIKSVEAWTKT